MTKYRKVRSPLGRKLLLLLEAGLVLGLSRSIRKRKLVAKTLTKEWEKINRSKLYHLIDDFKYHRLIKYEEENNGYIRIKLTEAGRARLLEFKIEEIRIATPRQWDGRWRVVFFDIPEINRKARDALRLKLKELGFWEWQKSVWVYPYACRDEIDFVVEFSQLRNYVRYAELTNPTNESELRLHFNL